VWTIALSPDGKKLVSRSEDGAVKLWDSKAMGCGERRDRPQTSEDRERMGVRKQLSDSSYNITENIKSQIKIWDTSLSLLLKDIHIG